MASEHPPYHPRPEPTMADKVADAVHLAECTIREAVLKLVKDTGLCICEIDVSHTIKSSAFGQELTNVGISTKIKLVKEL